MLDHFSLPVSDRERSSRFYVEALSPLGYEPIMEHHSSGLGFGQSGKPAFWIREGAPATVHGGAFAAADRATVEAFHERAIAVGGRDNGRPGLRPEYHPSYYGTYILDPDGNNVKAVCHRPARKAEQASLLHLTS